MIQYLPHEGDGARLAQLGKHPVLHVVVTELRQSLLSVL